MKHTFVILSCILFFSCVTDPGNSDTGKENVDPNKIMSGGVKNVPFTEAKNYFVKNTFNADALATPKISSQKDFDEVFGMASTMSPNGKPTPIDFSGQYVIAVIQPPTDKTITLPVESLVQKEDTIILSYTKTEGEKQSFITRPFILLVVDNTYSGNVVVRQQ